MSLSLLKMAQKRPEEKNVKNQKYFKPETRIDEEIVLKVIIINFTADYSHRANINGAKKPLDSLESDVKSGDVIKMYVKILKLHAFLPCLNTKALIINEVFGRPFLNMPWIWCLFLAMLCLFQNNKIQMFKKILI